MRMSRAPNHLLALSALRGVNYFSGAGHDCRAPVDFSFSFQFSPSQHVTVKLLNVCSVCSAFAIYNPRILWVFSQKGKTVCSSVSDVSDRNQPQMRIRFRAEKRCSLRSSPKNSYQIEIIPQKSLDRFAWGERSR
jgi:hypothetical protein